MLNAKEFAAYTNCPEIIENPEVAEFALFDIQLDKVINPETGEPFAPKAKQSVYEVRPWTEKTLAGLANATRKDEEKQAREEKKIRQANVDKWTERGYAFDERALTDPHGGAEKDAADEVEKSDDEWSDFWGGASPTEMIEV